MMIENKTNINKQSLVSIIVPVYNVEAYLEDCIKSLISQTYDNIEILLIDDGSTDSSSTICDTFSKQDNRIVVIHKQNQGVSVARNTGLEIAKGDYVCFVDSDDYVEASFVETLLCASVQYNADLVCCGVTRVINGRKDWERKPDRIGIFDHRNALIELYSENGFNGWPVNKIYRSEIIRQNSINFPIGIRYCEDEVFVMNYLLKCQKTVYLNVSLYYYVANNSSVNLKIYTNKAFDYAALDRIKADNIMLERIGEIGDKELIRVLKARLFISNIITLDKFMANYNGDKNTLYLIRGNLRRYFLPHLMEPRYKKTIKRTLKNIVLLINPRIVFSINSIK